MHIDLSQYVLRGKKAAAAHKAAVELIELMTRTKHAPSEVRLYPGDYNAIVNSIKRDFAKEDRANWRAENANRGKKDQVKWAEFSGKRVIDSVSHGSIPIVRGAHYSKPRKFEA